MSPMTRSSDTCAPTHIYSVTPFLWDIFCDSDCSIRLSRAHFLVAQGYLPVWTTAATPPHALRLRTRLRRPRPTALSRRHRRFREGISSSVLDSSLVFPLGSFHCSWGFFGWTFFPHWNESGKSRVVFSSLCHRSLLWNLCVSRQNTTLTG